MERIDKIISEQTPYTRKEIKEKIKKNKILLNGVMVKKPETKVSPEDIITIDGKVLTIKKHIYLILNKPKGYVSATKDQKDQTVLDLISKEYLHRNLFPAGRLDKDTTGLMIITDDGAFSHEILSPKKHVNKVYKVSIDIPITEEMIKGFKTGVKLNDGICKTATLEKLDESIGVVTLTEGRYHQIKRMFGAYNAKVIELQRIKIGNLSLPEDLIEGSFRELTEEELNKISKK